MENHKLVLPEHLNHYGYLFGGYLLKWVDEYAWIAATLDFPGHNFVTIGLDKVEFKKSVRQGSILRFLVERIKKGNSSVKYKITVFCDRGGEVKQDLIFSTNVTFVSVDKQGGKRRL